MMIGGETEVVQRLDPIFAALAPGIGDIPRTAGREKINGTAEQGYLHCGPNGAGHFVKMVHNGIEYGVMAAYAEGISILRKANAGQTSKRSSRRGNYAIARSRALSVRHESPRRRGGLAAGKRHRLVVAGSDRDSAAQDPNLSRFTGHVSDSGEGRWTIKAAIDEAVPAPVLTTALYERFSSRGEADFARQALVSDAV